MRILNAREMAEADRRTIEDLGVPSLVLMEEAGRECVESLLEELDEDPEDLQVLVVCGKGSNGGDGLVVARLLHNMGAEVRTLLLWPEGELRGDASANAAALRGAGGEVREAADAAAFRREAGQLDDWDVIVDAVFGTGLSGPVRGWRGEVLEAIGEAAAFVLSVDLPSGLSADHPRVEGPAVRADMTVTMAALKTCLALPPADGMAGDVVVAEIGIPEEALETAGPGLHLVEAAEAAGWAEPLRRGPESHKGSSGRVLVVAGSAGKSGAASLTCLGALRGGAGLVTLAVARSAWIPAAAAAPPEAMPEPVPEGPEGRLGRESVEPILRLAEGKDVLAIGPGLGREEETAEAVLAVLEDFPGPRVVDADGLHALGRAAAAGRRLRGSDGAPLLLTPHPGEMTFLLGGSVEDVLRDRVAAARACADRYAAHVLLKGHRSLAAGPGGEVRVNSSGGPVLATGGTGDVLTGLVAAFLAQGVAPDRSLPLAAWIHGWAGDLLAAARGEVGVLARDVAGILPEVIQAVLDGEIADA